MKRAKENLEYGSPWVKNKKLRDLDFADELTSKVEI